MQPTVTEIAALVQRLTITYTHDSKRVAAIKDGLIGKCSALPYLHSTVKQIAEAHTSPNARRVASQMLDRIRRLNVSPGETVKQAYAEFGEPKVGRAINDTFAKMGIEAIRIGKRTLRVTK